MFLMSEAFRALDPQQLKQWDWRSTTMLFISHDWDPSRDGAESLAGRRLVTALLEAGARVHVLAASRADEELGYDNYDVTVVPKPPFPRSKIGRAAHMVRSTIPEAEGGWVAGAVTAGLCVLSSAPADTIIYGRAMPGSSNIAAWHLARLTGLPWVAHFSDEWPSLQVLSRGRKWLAPYKAPLFRLWRQRIVRGAGALTFTNPDQAAEVLGPDRERSGAKAFVVPHVPSTPVLRHQPQYDVFHIVHAGNFYPPGHSSAALIQGLRMFIDQTPAARGRVRFTQAGWSPGDVPAWTARCGLCEVVRIVGRLTPPEVRELQGDASLLIGVDYARPGSGTVLSKLPDYLGAGRPILAITAPSSAMGRLFNEDGAGLTAHYDSPREVAQRIGAVFGAWLQRRCDPFLPRPMAVESFSSRRALAELAGACLVARRARAIEACHPHLARHDAMLAIDR